VFFGQGGVEGAAEFGAQPAQAEQGDGRVDRAPHRRLQAEALAKRIAAQSIERPGGQAEQAPGQQAVRKRALKPPDHAALLS